MGGREGGKKRRRENVIKNQGIDVKPYIDHILCGTAS